MLWRTLWEELSGPQAIAPTNAWHWPGVIAAMLLAGVAGFGGSGAAATGASVFTGAATVAHPAATAEAANPVAPSFKKSRRSKEDLLM